MGLAQQHNKNSRDENTTILEACDEHKLCCCFSQTNAYFSMQHILPFQSISLSV